MKLTPEQIEFFNREGWLFLPELFSPEEVDYLAREAVSRSFSCSSQSSRYT